MTLNIETHISSIKLMLDQMTYAAVIRLTTSSTYELIVRAKSKRKNRKISSLEKLISRL